MTARDERRRRKTPTASLAKRLRRRTLPELAEICRLALTMLYVDARLILLPQGLNRVWLHLKTIDARTPGARSREAIKRLVPLSRVAARYRIRRGNSCLVLSLALRARLAAMGLPSEIVYGIRKSSPASPAIDAHAWLRLGAYSIDPFGLSASFKPLA